MDMSSLVRGRRWRSISSLWYDSSHAHRVVSRILCLDLGGGFFLFLEYHCGFYVLSLPFTPVRSRYPPSPNPSASNVVRKAGCSAAMGSGSVTTIGGGPVLLGSLKFGT